ncbi:MAG: hypothetical protein LBD37_07075 [Treponema sp.]|jgi:hypothetical protein|nr:hypothetical protein [Treponema sp.]
MMNQVCYRGAFLLAAALLFAACEIPQTVSVKGSPGVYMHMGSPLGGSNPLQEQLNMAGLQEEIAKGFGNSGVEIYEYKFDQIRVGETAELTAANPETIDGRLVQTFLIRFRALNIEEKAGFKVDDPGISAGLFVPPILDALPWDSIPDNQKRVTLDLPLSITGDYVQSFVINNRDKNEYTTITLQGAADLRDALQLKADDLGIAEGKGTIAGNDLVFKASSEAPLVLQSSGSNPNSVPVTFTFLQKPEKSGYIPMNFALKWKQATINLRANDLKPLQEGKFPAPSLGDLTEFLGGLTFKSIPAYLYITLAGSVIPLKITIWSERNGSRTYLVGNTSNGESITSKLFSPPPAKSDAYNDDIYTASPPSLPPFNAAKAFGQKNTDLRYAVAIEGGANNQLTIQNTDDDTIKIQLDMLIVIPFQFEIEQTADNKITYKETGKADETFIKLDIDLLKELNSSSGGKDLFGRKKADDDLLGVKGIDLVSADIQVKKISNTMINGIYLGVIDAGRKEAVLQPLSFADNAPLQSISFTKDTLAYPFAPNFAIMVKPGPGGGKGVFTIQPLNQSNIQFDFQLAAAVKTRLDLKLTDL